MRFLPSTAHHQRERGEEGKGFHRATADFESAVAIKDFASIRRDS